MEVPPNDFIRLIADLTKTGFEVSFKYKPVISLFVIQLCKDDTTIQRAIRFDEIALYGETDLFKRAIEIELYDIIDQINKMSDTNAI